MARKWKKLMARAYPKSPMLRSLELNSLNIGIPYLRCNLWQRAMWTETICKGKEIFLIIYCCSLTAFLATFLCITKSIALVSPILLFHCGISGRTGCLSATLWPLIAENFTLAENCLYSIRTEVYEVISWNGNLPYIFIALDVYTDIWEKAAQWMGGCDYVHRRCFGSKAERVLDYAISCHWLWLHFPKKIGLSTEEVLRTRCCWLKLVLWTFPFFILITLTEANKSGDDSTKSDFGVGWISWKYFHDVFC